MALPELLSDFAEYRLLFFGVLLLAVLSAFVSIDWGRIYLIVPAILLAVLRRRRPEGQRSR